MAAQPSNLPRCLIIEDSDFDLRRITRMLQRGMEIELHAATTLAQARDLLKRARFDLILLDNSLPDGLGIDFASEIRENPRYAEIPILMISDWPSPFMYDKAMSAQIRRILGKDDFEVWYVSDALRASRIRGTSKQ